ncbi:hypothetical protein L914_21730 [Phytophthora nicotianae]|uniref:Uncharacterized protein n=1 Tax=Phytophthora nicotianae TaxID=4792 RepID=W2M519_PHYNI|nr:hypothetical protein L914_21730 [Phytophthora nicotianae]
MPDSQKALPSHHPTLLPSFKLTIPTLCWLKSRLTKSEYGAVNLHSYPTTIYCRAESIPPFEPPQDPEEDVRELDHASG